MTKEKKENSYNKKSIIKKIIIILVIIIIIGIIISLFPFLYFIGELFFSVFLDIPSKPKETHGEFPFELVYEYKGEKKTIKDTIVCDYEGSSWSLEGGNSRDWTCEFSQDNEYGQYIIDNINGQDLYIEVPEGADYYMGDKEWTEEDTRPLLKFIDDSTGTYYEEKDKIEAVDIEIIEWKPSKPLEGNIK